MERIGEVTCTYDSDRNYLTAVWRIPHYRSAVNQLKSPPFGAHTLSRGSSVSSMNTDANDAPLPYEYTWSMTIHPHGSRRAYSGFVSLYLYSEDELPASNTSSSTLSSTGLTKPVVSLTMKVMRMYDEMASAYKQTHSRKVYHSATGGFGFHHFISRQYLLDQESCFLEQDHSLTVTTVIKHLTCPDTPALKPDIGSTLLMTKDMTTRYEQMIQEPESSFADVTFVMDDKSIHAHKYILSARSPVFAAMFSSGMQEAKSSRIMIEDVDYDVMQTVIRYIYTGEIAGIGETREELSPMFVIKLFSAADKYHLKLLRDLCERFIANSLTAENVSSAMIAGHLHDSDLIKEQCFKLVYHFRSRGGFHELEDWSEVHRIPELIDEMMMYWTNMDGLMRI